MKRSSEKADENNINNLKTCLVLCSENSENKLFQVNLVYKIHR